MARVLWFLAMLSAFFVVGMRLAGLPLAVACAVDDLSADGADICVDSRDGSHQASNDVTPLDLDDSDSDEAAHGAAPLMTTPPSPPLDVPVREAAGGVGCGALAEVLALTSHVRDLDRPPRA
ncbi:MAG: hypothetical protein ABIQ16_15020 [Polyangiaceae bacterium]